MVLFTRTAADTAAAANATVARAVALIRAVADTAAASDGSRARLVLSATDTAAAVDTVGPPQRTFPRTPGDTASAVDTASALTNPVRGTRVSPPLALIDGPIAGSRITWTADLYDGTLTVETSIDAGATWQFPVSGAAIPRLVQGDVRTARTVLTRITLTRPTVTSVSPRVHRMDVEVAIDSSIEEVVPIGVFTLNDVSVSDTVGGLTVELAGADLSRKISRNRWDATYIVAAGTNYGSAIQDMVRNRYAAATFNFTSTDKTTPRLFFGEQSSNDPWSDAQTMAESIGFELFFDARGICTLRPEPDPEVGNSVWEFEESAQPTITSLLRRVTDENTYNKVIVTGEGTSVPVPVRAVAIDSDPASATYYLGPYGTVTLRFTSSLVITVEQANDAALALLRRTKGATEAVELTFVPMPALEPGDVVTVTRAKSKIAGRFLLDQIRIPLGAGEAMTGTGRRQRK